MARDYGRIKSSFWTSRDLRDLPRGVRETAAYLLTGPHTTALGCFRMPLAYVAEDMGLTVDEVRADIEALTARGWLVYDENERFVWVKNFLKHNPPENEKVWIHVGTLLKGLPTTFLSYNRVLDTVPEPYRKGIDRVSEPYRTPEPLPEPEPEPKEEVLTHLSADADPPGVSSGISEAIEIYNSEADRHGWPKAQRLTTTRTKALRGRLRECGGLDGWREAMRKAGASGFLNGTARRGEGHANWRPDLDFFLQQSSFTKLMEGKYDGRTGGSKSITEHLADWARDRGEAEPIQPN